VGISHTPILTFTQNVLRINELVSNNPTQTCTLHPPLYMNKGKQELGCIVQALVKNVIRQLVIQVQLVM
jgi:hypothetical protein